MRKEDCVIMDGEEGHIGVSEVRILGGVDPVSYYYVRCGGSSPAPGVAR